MPNTIAHDEIRATQVWRSGGAVMRVVRSGWAVSAVAVLAGCAVRVARRLPRSSSMVLAGVAVLLGRGATAQQLVELRPDSRCQACRIALSRVATLASDGFAIDDARTIVLRDNGGQFLAAGENGTAIGVYSPTGRFLRRVGRRGDRLGEFRGIAAILIGPGDSIHVFDSALGRRTVFDPAMRKAVRMSHAPRFGDVALVGQDRLFTSGSLPTRESAGQPLHLADSNGAIMRSFGAEDLAVAVRGNESRRLYRSIAPARGGGYWVAPATQYTIERWTDQLKRERVLQRSVDWFPPLPADAVLRSPESDRPPTMLRNVWEEPGGLLMLNIGVAAADWQPTAATTEERSAVSDRELSKYIDTIIEVVDSRSGTVLASHRTRGIFGQVRNGPYLWSLGAAGSTAVDVFRMEYVQR